MSKVFVNIGLSLDGYMAPEGMTLAPTLWASACSKAANAGGPEHALALARKAAGSRDGRVDSRGHIAYSYAAFRHNVPTR
jgi:hypothetical protein